MFFEKCLRISKKTINFAPVRNNIINQPLNHLIMFTALFSNRDGFETWQSRAYRSYGPASDALARLAAHHSNNILDYTQCNGRLLKDGVLVGVLTGNIFHPEVSRIK